MVHVKNEYDYRYESDFRKEIFEAIKYVYWKAHGKNIKVFGKFFLLSVPIFEH